MTRARGRGPTLAKDINRKLVYALIKRKRSATRAELAVLLGLNKNTVSAIVDELISSGFVREFGQQRKQGAGRRPIGIEYCAANRWAAGIQLTSSVLHGVVTDLYAAPLETFSVPLQGSRENDPETVFAVVTELINRIAGQFALESSVGVGIGIPGLLDESRTRVIRSSHLGWEDVPAYQMIASRIRGLPLIFDNSIKLASLGELWSGSGQGTEHFVYCSFGTGVGCGLVVGGTVVRGDAGAAGELGHLTIDSQGPLCRCGNRGCLEAVVGLPSLCGRLGLQSEGPENQKIGEWLAEEWEKGNEAVAEEMERAGRAIGQALSCVVNLLNPKFIICDGPLMLSADRLFPIMERELRSRTISFVGERVSLVRSPLFPLTGAIGAAAGAIAAWEDQTDPLALVTC